MKLLPPKVVCYLALLTLGTSASAYVTQPFLTKEPLDAPMTMPGSNSRVVTFSLGASWAGGHSLTETLAPEIINTYASNNNNDVFVVGEIFAGMEHVLTPGWLGQLGIALAGGGNVNMSGDIWANADPVFDNYYYQYSVNRVYAGLKGKLLADVESSIGIQPYVSGSLGLSFNHAYGYSSAPKIPEEVAAPPFGSNVTPSFSYAVGAGIQKAFAPNWSVGVGYEFSDWGSSSLSPVPGATQSKALVLDHLYNNAVLVNLSYHG